MPQAAHSTDEWEFNCSKKNEAVLTGSTPAGRQFVRPWHGEFGDVIARFFQ